MSQTEISWRRVSHPREVLKVGQKVDVKVLGVDKERKRISLSIRELEQNPWDQIVESFEEGQLVEGTVTKLTDFGAFASLAGTGDFDIEGLIHVSELADQRVGHPRELVQEGQVVTLRIIKIDNNRRRIGLSLKRVSSAEYSEQDWRVAMQEMQTSDSAQGEVEDFDAALDAAEEDIPAVEDEGETIAASVDTIDESAADEIIEDEISESEAEVAEEIQVEVDAAKEDISDVEDESEVGVDAEAESQVEMEVEDSEDEEKSVSPETEPVDEDKQDDTEGTGAGGDMSTDDPPGDAVETN